MPFDVPRSVGFYLAFLLAGAWLVLVGISAIVGLDWVHRWHLINKHGPRPSRRQSKRVGCLFALIGGAIVAYALHGLLIR